MFGNNLKKIEKLARKKNSDSLVKFLTSKDSQVRLAAIRGLGEAGGEPAFNNLTSLLRNADPIVRAAAASALEVLKSPKAVAFITNRLKDETDAAAATAMRKALGVLHEKN